MPLYGRVIMGCLAAFMAWSMLRAWRTGVAYDENATYVENDQPTMFIAAMAGQLFAMLFAGAMAAGFTPQEFFAQFGLDKLFGDLSWLCPPNNAR